MTTPVRIQQPTEKRTRTFDFGPKLTAGDALTGSPTVTLDPPLLLGTTTVVGNKVHAQISGGVDGVSYKAQVRMNTVQGDIVELDVVIQITEGEN